MQQWTIQDVTLKAAFPVPFMDIYPFFFLQWTPNQSNKYQVVINYFMHTFLICRYKSCKPSWRDLPIWALEGCVVLCCLVQPKFIAGEVTWKMSASTAVGSTRFLPLWDNKGWILYEAGEKWLCFNGVLRLSLNLSGLCVGRTGCNTKPQAMGLRHSSFFAFLPHENKWKAKACLTWSFSSHIIQQFC